MNYTWKVWFSLLPYGSWLLVFHYSFTYLNICTMQQNYPRLSAAVAGDRKYDVYMGIDVFGRGSFGGGQWNVCDTLIL